MIKEAKFLRFFEHMDTTEWRRFRRFLKSPYFNTNKNLLILADELRKFHPFYDQEDFTKENLYSKIYKTKKPYKVESFNSLANLLVKLVHQFFLQEALTKEAGMQRQLRLKALKEKQLDDLFFKEAERQKNELLLEEKRGEDFHYSMFLLYHEIYIHPNSEDSKNTLLDLKKGLFHLQEYILWNSLKWELATENIRFVMGDKIVHPLFNVINQSGFSENSKAADLSFSKEMIAYLKKPTNQKFQTLTKHFFEYIHQFTPSGARTFLLTFLNILAPKIRKQKDQFIPIALKFYKLGFLNRIFIENQELSQTTFLNAITVGCGCQDFEWVNNVIEQYGQFLHSSQREDTLKYGKLLYYYSQGDSIGGEKYFKQVIEIFHDVQQIPKRFNISVRTMLCRSHYELLNKKNPNTDFLESFCASFFKYLERNLEKEIHRKEVFKLFIQNIRQLLKILNDIPNRHALIVDFEEYLSKNTGIFAHEWFLKKIRELNLIP